MKLCFCVVHSRDKNRIIEALVNTGFKFTIVGSTGGFLREGNSTFLIGCEDNEVDTLVELFGANCQVREQIVNVMSMESGNPAGGFIPNPVKVPVGGSIIFVTHVERFERL
jgi:uncharacterized protein YaaQ